jgi:coenzyme F420-reducing hydrogenase alpha subunit
MNEGRVTTSRGLSIAVTDFEQHFAECHVPHSTALQSLRIPENTPYFVGPLARVHLNRDRLSPAARQLSGELGIDWPCFNPYRSILARGLEMVHAYEEALDIITDYRAFQPGRLDYQPKASEGMAATEAPRGMIYHRYQVDDQGHIALAKIVPPTSQNQRQIECDLQALIGPMLDQDDESIARRCEQYIRNYDPCISCSTHFLRLSIERR